MGKKLKTPVRIRTKELANGTKSIYLDIYHNGERRYEFLKLYLNPGRDPLTKLTNENTMTAAVAIQAQRIKEITNEQAGINTARSKITLDKYIAQRIEIKHRQGKSANMLTSLMFHLERYTGNKMPAITAIDKAWITGFMAYLAHAHVEYTNTSDRQKATKKSTKTITETTQAHRMITLNAILNSAIVDGIIDRNPMQLIARSDKPRIKPEERSYLTIEELKRMEEASEGRPEQRAFLFGCYTGLRISDIRALTWGMIRTRGEKVVLSKFIQKSQKWMELPLNTKATQCLGERKEDGELIFDIKISQTKQRTLAAWTEKACIKKHVTFHTSRHTFATIALTLGADIYTVSELLGHSDISTTQIYAKIVDSKKRNAVDLFDNL